MTFGSTFKNSAQLLYSVTFDTSNVLKTEEKLKKLEFNLINKISTGKHAVEITIDDVNLVITSIKALRLHYELIHNSKAIPSKLKLYEMIKVIREHEKPDAKEIAKEALIEILNPKKTASKLTKKQELAELASKKSVDRKMKIIKKLVK